MAAVNNTVRNLLASIGIDGIALFNGETNAERLASDMFDDNFASCINKSDEDIDSDLKTYSSMTLLQGQIRLNPGSKRNLKVAIQWVKDLLRTDNDPITTLIPNVLNTVDTRPVFLG